MLRPSPESADVIWTCGSAWQSSFGRKSRRSGHSHGTWITMRYLRNKGRRRCAGSSQLGFKAHRPQRAIVPILERHGHDLRCSVDRDVAEELQAIARRLVRRAWRLYVRNLRSDRCDKLDLGEASSGDRTRDAFPNRIQI